MPRRWAQSLSGPLLDCFDLTATLDERGDIRPRIAFQVGKDEDQELPASEASVSGVAIGVAGHRDDPTGEHLYLIPTIVPDVHVKIPVFLPVSGGYR